MKKIKESNTKHTAAWVVDGSFACCSNCGMPAHLNMDSEYQIFTPYCPYCGFSMTNKWTIIKLESAIVTQSQ